VYQYIEPEGPVPDSSGTTTRSSKGSLPQKTGGDRGQKEPGKETCSQRQTDLISTFLLKFAVLLEKGLKK